MNISQFKDVSNFLVKKAREYNNNTSTYRNTIMEDIITSIITLSYVGIRVELIEDDEKEHVIKINVKGEGFNETFNVEGSNDTL